MCYQEITVGFGNNTTLIHNLHFLIKSHINLDIHFFLFRVTDMHRDRGFGRAADTDIAFDSNLEWKNTRAPGGSTGHSDLYNPSRSTTFVHWHGPRWQPRPLSTSVWPLVPRQTMDMDTDPDCVFNMDPGRVLGWSLCWMSPWPWLAMQITQISVDPAAPCL